MKKMMVLVVAMVIMVMGTGCGVQEKVEQKMRKAMIEESGIIQTMIDNLNEGCEHDGWTAYEKADGDYTIRHTVGSDYCTKYIEENPTFIEDLEMTLNGEIVRVY